MTMSTMRWVRVVPSDLKGQPPIARSGHSAVRVGKSMVVIFGGLLDKRFLSDLVVLDFEKKIWFKPECTGSETDGQVGPSPRAFHVAVSIDCHMFIFGGRCGRKRLGDFWMLDTDIWQWTELTGYGDLPPARDFAAGAAVGNRKLVMHGGWDGSKWLSDVYVLDTMTLEWTQLPITGSSPTPRCGHTATMVERRLLIFGGRGGGGPIMGDLWALKGLFEEENESPAWTQLKLSGQAPTARCGHTVTSGGTQLLVFGGHGTGGWLTRYDVYYNDCIVLDRSSVQWKRLPINNEPPSARAYHTMTRVGSRFFLFGGYDGKSTFGDMWWLVPEDDPIAKRASQPPGECISFSETLITDDPSQDNTMVEGNTSLRELRNRLGLPNMVSFATQFKVVDISEDKELLALASMLVPRRSDEQKEQNVLIKEMREKWKESIPASIKLRELGPLLRDYQRLVCHLPCKPDLGTCRFYHLMDVKQLRMSDIPYLLNEYKEILSMSTYKFS